MNSPPTGVTYKSAGVDIDAGNTFAGMIKVRVRIAWPDKEREIGGFAGGGPIPVGARVVKGSCDGTGTKAILASLAGRFDGLGQDAVAMAAVDMYVDGNRPLYILDTVSCGRLMPEQHIKIIDSIVSACKLAGCALIGGETAELPGMYKYPWIVDVNVTAIGFPAPELTFEEMTVGDKVIGWLSHGPGSNGYSLLRRVFGLSGRPSRARPKLAKVWKEFGGITLAEALLKPTPIYIPQMEQLRTEFGAAFAGHAHITGGGLVENIPRMLPSHLKVVIQRDRWQRPPVFRVAQELGKIPDDDMDRTFNQGIMVVSVVKNVSGSFDDLPFVQIGVVERRKGNKPQVELVGKYWD